MGPQSQQLQQIRAAMSPNASLYLQVIKPLQHFKGILIIETITASVSQSSSAFVTESQYEERRASDRWCGHCKTAAGMSAWMGMSEVSAA